MANYRISQISKEDLIRIHRYGIKKFGVAHADKYYDSLIHVLKRFLRDHILLNLLNT